MKWLDSAGGPLVVVAASDVDQWSASQDDYAAASAIEDVTGVVDFGESAKAKMTAWVIWDEPLSTTYLPHLEILVQWLYADSEEALLGMIAAEVSSAAWVDGPMVRISSTAILFDAAVPGPELTEDDFIEIPLAPGLYQAQVADLEPGGREAARVHRLVLVQHDSSK